MFWEADWRSRDWILEIGRVAGAVMCHICLPSSWLKMVEVLASGADGVGGTSA